MLNKQLEKSISKSQHCQRNWDLSKEITPDDLNTLIHAVTQCPSKQNETFYSVTVIKNRKLIEEIHSYTDGFSLHDRSSSTVNNDGSLVEGVKTVTNSQTLANVLFVFSKDNPDTKRSQESVSHYLSGHELKVNEDQRLISLGIASGYLNLTANLLGYSTGCCSCFDYDKVNKIVQNPMLLMGVGFRDSNRSRLEHHNNRDFRFPSFGKKITCNIMEWMNFLITGHTKGIGKAIYDRFGGIGLSRSNGFDISINHIGPYLSNIDVFVNNAFDDNNPWSQTKLLYESLSVKKIICIGSNSTDQTKMWPHPYQSAKLALENSCNQLFYQGYNITLIKLGWVNTDKAKNAKPEEKKIDTNYVTDLVDWILHQKYRIKELTVVPN